MLAASRVGGVIILEEVKQIIVSSSLRPLKPLKVIQKHGIIRIYSHALRPGNLPHTCLQDLYHLCSAHRLIFTAGVTQSQPTIPQNGLSM